jgi:hypothetical protein
MEFINETKIEFPTMYKDENISIEDISYKFQHHKRSVFCVTVSDDANLKKSSFCVVDPNYLLQLANQFIHAANSLTVLINDNHSSQ